MRVLLITNIITPYRQVLYNACAAVGRRKGIEWHTSFMARGEATRKWRAEDYPLNHEHVFHWGLHLPLPGRPIATHLNPGAWWTQLRGRWDAVIVGGYDHLTSAVAGLLPARGRKLLWCESSVIGSHPRRKWDNAVKAALWSGYQGFVVPGQRAREHLCTIRPSIVDRPFLLLPNVVNEEQFRGIRAWPVQAKAEARRRWGIDPDHRVLISVARLDHKKGVHRILAAISGRLDVPITLLVAGDGPMREQIASQAESAQNIHVRMVGYQNEAKVCELLALSDGFILGSLWDAGPMAMVEAAMAGLPLVCSDRAGYCPDLVVPGWNGWVFDTTDPDSIRTAVRGWANTSDAELQNMGMHSAKLADEKFSAELGIARFLDQLIEFCRYGRVTEDTFRPVQSTGGPHDQD